MAGFVIPSVTMITPTQPSITSTPVGQTQGAGGVSFADYLGKALDQVNAVSQHADALAQSYAMGGNVSTAQLMIAESQASLGVDMLAQVGTRVQQAYSSVMNMQV